MVAADAEPAAYANAQLTRLGSDDIDAGVRRAERRARQRPSILLVPAEPGVEQQVRASVISVGHSDVLHAHLVAAAVYLQQIRLGIKWLLVEIRKEVADGELVVAPDIISLEHELIIGPVLAGAKIIDLLEWPVGERKGIQEELRHRTDPVGGNLIVWKRRVVVQGIGELDAGQI